MGDPNWLLSTCAQASAAIIAILGGFFVSRLMTLYTEKNGTTSELNEINNKLTFKLHALGELEKKKLNMDQEEFFEKCETHIIKKAAIAFQNGEDINELESYFDQYYIRYNERGREYEELKPYFDNKVSAIKRAFIFFQSHNKDYKYINENLDKFIIKNNIEVEDYNIYRDVFKAILESNEKLPSKTIRNISYINKVNSKIEKIKSIPQLQKYEKLIYDIEARELELKYLEQHKEQLESKIKYFEKPKGLVWAVLIFIYFSVVGIIIPMFLMPMSVNKFTYKLKYTVISLFISGIVLVFTYFVSSIKYFNKK